MSAAYEEPNDWGGEGFDRFPHSLDRFHAYVGTHMLVCVPIVSILINGGLTVILTLTAGCRWVGSASISRIQLGLPASLFAPRLLLT
jgi:hypothetical protein